MQSDQLHYFTTIGLQFQQTCLLILSLSLVRVPHVYLAEVKLFHCHAKGEPENESN